jgi:hypothetical protein
MSFPPQRIINIYGGPLQGIHLSYIENDIFINGLQSALKLFISRPYIQVYPER